jgi:hypothetical protein
MAIPVPTSVSQDAPNETVIQTLFHTNRSRKAANLFLQRLIALNGRMTEVDMSKFVGDLKSGELDAKLSRGAFYGYILPVFLRQGLIRLGGLFDSTRRKIIPTYFVVVQSVGKRAPVKPSLAYNAYVLQKAWNQVFSEIALGGS